MQRSGAMKRDEKRGIGAVVMSGIFITQLF